MAPHMGTQMRHQRGHLNLVSQRNDLQSLMQQKQLAMLPGNTAVVDRKLSCGFEALLEQDVNLRPFMGTEKITHYVLIQGVPAHRDDRHVFKNAMAERRPA